MRFSFIISFSIIAVLLLGTLLHTSPSNSQVTHEEFKDPRTPAQQACQKHVVYSKPVDVGKYGIGVLAWGVIVAPPDFAIVFEPDYKEACDKVRAEYVADYLSRTKRLQDEKRAKALVEERADQQALIPYGYRPK